MPDQVRNLPELIANGQTGRICQAREYLLRAYESALAAADPSRIMLSQLQYNGSSLIIQGREFDLSRYANISVIGAGKAGAAMVSAIENLLGDRISLGLVNVPTVVPECANDGHSNLPLEKNRFLRVKLCSAGHPVPDEAGMSGANAILKIAEAAEADDLLICLISGGGSSLMPLPRYPLTLDDKRALTTTLLRSGASISEINTVRKHISAIKGGWLAYKAWPATVISLILSDVPGDPLDFIASGPTVPDTSTFADACEVMCRYNLLQAAPARIRKLIEAGMCGALEETPKGGEAAFARCFNFVIGNNRTARVACAEALNSAGFKVEMKEELYVGPVERLTERVISDIDRIAAGCFSSGPMAMIAGGELTLDVTGNGKGGRNQEMALAMAAALHRRENLVFAALGTDGIDGPTDAAGAIVDGFSLSRGIAAGMCAEDHLLRHDSWHYFRKLGDLVLTGYTGTNVNDLFVAVAI